MKRREFIAIVCGLAVAWPAASLSQQTPIKRPLIGWLGGATPASGGRQLDGLIRGLRERGYIDGTNIDIEYRWAEGDISRQPSLAEELLQLKPAVIVTANHAGAVAVKRASATTPIVCPTLVEPVRLGLVASHARPGTNVTGILFFFDGLAGKQLELLAELVPGVSRVGTLFTASDTSAMRRKETEVAAGARRIKLVAGEVRSPNDIERALQALAPNIEAVIVPPDVMFFTEARRIVPWLATARLPGIHSYREHVEAGGLISYGINIPESFRRAAHYVDSILKGAKPDDLPVEFPTKLELVINSRTARELGISIPQSILLRADDLIE